MINEFMKTLYVSFRGEWVEDNQGNGYSEEQEIGSFYGHMQQVSADEVKSLDLTFTTSFKIWCPVGSSVLVGDTLKCIDGQFSVKEIKEYNIGCNKHLVLYVQKDKNLIGS